MGNLQSHERHPKDHRLTGSLIVIENRVPVQLIQQSSLLELKLNKKNSSDIDKIKVKIQLEDMQNPAKTAAAKSSTIEPEMEALYYCASEDVTIAQEMQNIDSENEHLCQKVSQMQSSSSPISESKELVKPTSADNITSLTMPPPIPPPIPSLNPLPPVPPPMPPPMPSMNPPPMPPPMPPLNSAPMPPPMPPLNSTPMPPPMPPPMPLSTDDQIATKSTRKLSSSGTATASASSSKMTNAPPWLPVHYTTCMRKQPVNPNIPMKPLYWSRILLPAESEATVSNAITFNKNSLWAEIDEEKNVDIKEFSELFSRQVNERKPMKKSNTSNPPKLEAAKILDPKRSKMVGILEKSLHVDFVEVEHAIYSLDTSTISLETLQQIYEIRPTAKELENITAHERENPHIPLDSPELFLQKLSSIQFFSERIACLSSQAEFADGISSISSKLTNLHSVCDFMLKSSSLRHIMSLILTFGNYMNGGNMIRGQADGFGLDILSKLKDVKSNVPGETLLHYIVKVKLSQECNRKLHEPIPLPVPEPADVQAASTINFDDLHKELDTLTKRIEDCIKKYATVIKGDPEHAGPFKLKMDFFLEKAQNELANEIYELQVAKRRFQELMQYYQYIPKGKTIDAADPEDFFVLWISFCHDFKDIWNREQQVLRKIDDIREKIKEQRNIETVKKKEGGLKDRIQKLKSKR